MVKLTTAAVRCTLIILFCATVLIFALWVPSIHTLVCKLLQENHDQVYFLHYFVYPIASIIMCCALGVILVAFKFPASIKRDEIFSYPTAKKLSIISYLLSVASVLGFISALMLFLIGEHILSPVLAFAFLIGGCIALMLAILSSYVKRAAILKEEADHTL